jgi:hypothetical protein
VDGTRGSLAPGLESQRAIVACGLDLTRPRHPRALLLASCEMKMRAG